MEIAKVRFRFKGSFYFSNFDRGIWLYWLNIKIKVPLFWLTKPKNGRLWV